jgi:hypothetical protein
MTANRLVTMLAATALVACSASAMAETASPSAKAVAGKPAKAHVSIAGTPTAATSAPAHALLPDPKDAKPVSGK